MEITEIRVSLQDENVLKAFASITLDDQFVVRGLKVIGGRDGLFVAMPARKKKDGTFQDIAHATTQATRDQIEQAVLRAYDEASGEERGVHSPLKPKPPTIVGQAARVMIADEEPTTARSKMTAQRLTTDGFADRSKTHRTDRGAGHRRTNPPDPPPPSG